ncbi:tetratricopeptide repeat protein [Marinilabilia salmonicolor]|uniref:tetratricopeptide repeat protein n=1 Tax=Marinilabilia salmonicolor TaxID=989 RepID=UPI00029AB1C3|nr:tetratricopeptide repeat protein [Marinilabilia salmonicolor]
MSRMRLIEFLSHPEKLDEKSLETLREALDAYPFFQAGRMLWVKNLYQLDHIRYNNELKLSAAFIPDRSKLFFLINDAFSSLSAPESGDEENEKKDAPAVFPVVSEDNPEKDQALSDNYEETDDSGKNLDQVVGAEANYFDVDDSFTTLSGNLVDFSLSRHEDNENVTEPQEEPQAEPLPASKSDFLDYEKEVVSSAYSLETEIAPDKPDFSAPHSFSEWLELMKYQSSVSSQVDEEDKQAEKKKPDKMDLIDNFLNSGGSQKRIVPKESGESSNEDFSARSGVESDDLMTETLANIHIKQKRYQKAVEIFERLRLKYPEKSVYFARRIKEMEDLINNQ